MSYNASRYGEQHMQKYERTNIGAHEHVSTPTSRRSWLPSPGQNSPVVEERLRLQLLKERMRCSLRKGATHSCVCLAVFLYIQLSCFVARNMWYLAQWGLVWICALSACLYFLQYFFNACRLRTVHGNAEQRRLLSVDDTDKSFVTLSNKCYLDVSNASEVSIFQLLMLMLNMAGKNFASRFRKNRLQCDCKVCESWTSCHKNEKRQEFQKLERTFLKFKKMSQSTPNPVNMHVSQRSQGPASPTSPRSPPNNRSALSSNGSFFSPYGADKSQDTIANEQDLLDYIRLVQENESRPDGSMGTMVRAMSNTVNSFWKFCNGPTNWFLPTIYQCAPFTGPSQDSGRNEASVANMLGSYSEVMKGVSFEQLVQYVANLRRWLSLTIVERLWKEIKAANHVFKVCGFNDLEIGSISLERLRKVIEDREMVNRYLPTLPLIFRFLKLCDNQEYLVQRIKCLARGSCLTDYNWNNSSDAKWDSKLPSDAAILFHLFCVYMDSQLMPMPESDGGRPFYNLYVVMDNPKRQAKDTVKLVRNRAQCAILCSDPLRPKFNFISGDEILNCVCDCNNLFYIIIQFLMYMRKHRDSMLEGVSLGAQGINIMCVVED